MQMLALKAHRYGNAERRPGEQFEVRRADVRLMKALGWQTEAAPAEAPPAAPPAAPKAKRSYTRKIVKAEATVAAPAEPAASDLPDLADQADQADQAAEGQGEPEPEPVQRTYLRRDLVAEGE